MWEWAEGSGGHTGSVRSAAFSPDGQLIVSGPHDKTIWIWDVKTGAAVDGPLEGHTSYVLSVAYSPDGQHIISGSHYKTIRIWDAKTGAAVSKPLKGHTSSDLCGLFLTPLIGTTLSLDLMTIPFKPGMPRLVLQYVNRYGAILALCSLSLTLLMGSTSSMGPVTEPSVCGTHFHSFPFNLQLPTQCMSTFIHSQTQIVGSKTQRVVCYIGYPQTLVVACIHLLSTQPP
jgi:WD40 repeat protein